MKQRINTFYSFLNDMDDKEYFENFLSYSVALISARLKPSITMNLIKGGNRNNFHLWMSYGEEYLKTLGLNYIKLRENHQCLIVLIYDKELLNEFINKPWNYEFLNSIGYENNMSLDGILERLKGRYDDYNCPHELGIFVGYPLEDVKDFMECSKKQCLACGYWKVYNKFEKAEFIFNIYDEVKETAIKNIIEGKRHKDLSDILRYEFEQKNSVILG